MNTGGVHFLPLNGLPLGRELKSPSPVPRAEPENRFLIGQENAMLEPLIQGIISGGLLPEQLPVLLYGASGTGKTHLLKGLLAAQRKIRTEKGNRAYYLSADDFCRQFADAVAGRTTGEFRQRYGNAALLLLDNIDHLDNLDRKPPDRKSAERKSADRKPLERKPAVLQELRHFIDTAAAETRIIVMTSKTLPAGTDDWTARLIGGTVLPIFPPEMPVRQEFLRSLAGSLRIPFTETLLHEAAKQITGTIPQIYAAVVQKYAEYTAKNSKISAAFWTFAAPKRFRQTDRPAKCPVKSPINSPLTSSMTSPMGGQTLAEITERTAKYFALKGSDLKGKSRSKTTALARSMAVYLIKTQHGGTFREIGKFFGSRDPSTIRHMYEKITEEMISDTVLRDHLFRLSNR